MKKKTLLLSILSIIMCLSLTVGGTFALFTSKSEVNVAVTSGTVDVVATVENVEYSFDQRLTEASDCEYVVDGANLTINKMLPGDTLTATIAITNNSTVAIQYRVKTAISGELADYLVITSVNKNWVKVDAGVQIPTETVIVTLPYEVEDPNAEGKTANVVITVESIQGNADTTFVNSAEDLAFAISKGGDVTLQDDITVDEAINIEKDTEINIDLNGKKLISNSADGYTIKNENGGTLYLSGAPATYALRKATVVSGCVEGVVYTGEGSTTIVNGGTYNAAEDSAYVFLNSQGTLIINDATINGGSSYPIYSYNDGHKLVINNATVNGVFGCVNAYANGTVEINDGEYSITGVKGKTSHIVYVSGTTKMTINGGTFKKVENDISMSSSGGGGICTMSSAELVINGGSFAGDYRDLYVWSTNSKITVNGGTFKFNPTGEGAKIGEGYKVYEKDGVYTVRKELKANVNNAYISATTIWGEWSGTASESFVIKFFYEGKEIASTSLNNIGGIIDGDVTVTWNLDITAELGTSTKDYWTYNWNEKLYLVDGELKPITAVLYIDGYEMGSAVAQLNGPDNLNKIVAVSINENGEIDKFLTTVGFTDLTNPHIVLIGDIDLSGPIVIG